MNSEKVKEIKESLQQEIHLTEYVDSTYSENVSLDLFKDVLSIINELETENERLMKLQARGGCRVAELGIENQHLKDKISELENTDYYKEIEKKKEDLLCKEYSLIKYEKEIAGKYLKKFAEKLKECAQTNLDHFTGFQKVILTEQIDELLKEHEKWTEVKDAYQIGQLNELKKV